VIDFSGEGNDAELDSSDCITAVDAGVASDGENIDLGNKFVLNQIAGKTYLKYSFWVKFNELGVK